MNEIWACLYIETQWGVLSLIADQNYLLGVVWGRLSHFKKTVVIENQHHPVLMLARTQILNYLQGEIQSFTVPIRLIGTDFQKSVWLELGRIPFGQTISYKDLAARIGNPKAVRAVGGANNKNPLCLIVPCHRVIGSNGELVGYAGGLEAKEKLLGLEAAAVSPELGKNLNTGQTANRANHSAP